MHLMLHYVLLCFFMRGLKSVFICLVSLSHIYYFWHSHKNKMSKKFWKVVLILPLPYIRILLKFTLNFLKFHGNFQSEIFKSEIFSKFLKFSVNFRNLENFTEISKVSIFQWKIHSEISRWSKKWNLPTTWDKPQCI